MSMPGDSPDGGTGLVVALPAEAHSLGARGMHVGDCARWRRGWMAVSGIGPHNAMRAAERLLACGASQLANWGVAGALDAGFTPGDVLIPDHVRYNHDDPGFATDPLLDARLIELLSPRLRVRRGVLWSAPQPIATAADKQALAARSGAVAVDMEAAPIAAVAARAKLPVAAGEEWRNVYEASWRLDTAALAVVQPEIAHTGVTQFMAITRLAASRGAAVMPHATIGVGIFMAASLHASAAVGGVPYHEYQHSIFDRNLRYVDTTMSCAAGYYGLPDGPGHGVTPRPELWGYVRR